MLERRSASSRQKLYLIIVFSSLCLLFLGVWQATPVIVQPDAPLGLASYLPAVYWLGLALVAVTCVLAFLDHEAGRDIIFIPILIAVGLFLFGIRVFLYECAQDTDSYYPVSVVSQLLTTHHLDIDGSPTIWSYYSWPAIHFLSASLLEVTQADLPGIMKYTPLVWLPCFVLITYGIGKRLKLAPNRCFLLSLLALSSWVLSYSAFYYPRFVAMILLLAILMLSLTSRTTAPEFTALILMFGALVISHGEVAMATVLGLGLLALFRREYRPVVVLLLVVFGAWYLYQASTYVDYGIRYLSNFLRDFRELTQSERYEAPAAATGRIVARYSQLLSLGIFAVMMISSILLLVRRKTPSQNRSRVIVLFAWAIGLASFALFGQSQALVRSFVKCIVPATGIVALSISSKKVLVATMCIFIGLSLFVNYADIAGFGQATTTSLAGAKHLALEVRTDSYFADTRTALAAYYDPDLTKAKVSGATGVSAPPPDEVDLLLLSDFHHVVIGEETSNALIFSWGRDPYLEWPNTDAGNAANLIYDNGHYRIFENG